MIGLNEEGDATDEEKIELITEFMAEHDMNYPCALISPEVKEQIPDFQGYPTTLFIDRAGKVRLKIVGLHDYAYLEAIVKALLAEEAPAADAVTPPPGEAATAPGATADEETAAAEAATE